MCKGGLGNQMFQYALYRKYIEMGVDTRISTYHYLQETGMMPFMLPEVFPNLQIKYLEDDKIRKNFLKRNNNRSFLRKAIEKINPKLRSYVVEKKEMNFSKRYLKYKNAVLDGYWQTNKYWKDIEQSIKKEFEFVQVDNKDFLRLKEFIITHKCTSIHIRRGDYLKEENRKMYGNICTSDYYRKAVEYIECQEEQEFYIVFTDDKAWVKEHFYTPKIVFASDYLKGVYPDWYELCLQSYCTNNIIANSTFSWWAAYLNANPKRVVVAPKIWINNRNTKDVWPSDWVKL